MESKTHIAKALYLSGDLKAALKIVKDFRLGLQPQERKALSLGYEAIVHPSFYVQLRKNPAELVDAATEVLRRMFNEC